MAIDLTPATNAQQLFKLANRNQEELQKVSIQIATGFKNVDFKGFASDGATEKFLSLQAKVSSLQNYNSSNDQIIARLKTMDLAVDQIQQVASQFSQLITQVRNSASSDNIPFLVQASDMLDSIAGKLNTNYDGRYLFAGSKTDTQPVTNIQSSNLDETDQPTASYYQGDSTKPSVQISITQNVEYGELASAQGFQELIGAIHLAIRGYSNDSDQDLQSAIDMLNDSISNITTTRAQIQSNIITIQNANLENKDVELVLSQELVTISQTDIVTATTKMSELQATVQASYLAYTRMNQLRLANFL